MAERVSLALTAENADCRTETDNLSAAGAYCTLDQLIPPMTKLQLYLQLPNGRRLTGIRCSGVVVRVEPVIATIQRSRYRTAIMFTNLTDRQRTRISRFVLRRLAAAAPTD